MTAEQTLADLGSSEKGLSPSEAAARLQKYGPNELKKAEKEPWWKKFLKQFNNFLVLILIFAAVVSMITWAIEKYVMLEAGVEQWPTDSFVIWAILIINAILGYVQEARAEGAIEALMKLSAAKATVIRDGVQQQIFAAEMVPGDIFVLETGDQIPADGRVLWVQELKVEEASLTGESTGVGKKIAPLADEDTIPVGDQKNAVFSTTIVVYGRGRAVATATGMGTEIGKIATMIEEAGEQQTPMQQKLEQFGKTLGYLILVICAIVFIEEVVIDLMHAASSGADIDIVEELLAAFMVAISLAVAAIPEGLPAVVTTTLAIGVQRMSKRNAIIRKLPACETLGAASVICSDKTGTLTKNQMTIRKVYTNFKSYDVEGRGFEPVGEILLNGQKVSAADDKTLSLTALAGAMCNNSILSKDAESGQWKIIGDPTEGAFIVLAGKMGIDLKVENEKNSRIHEVFFDSNRKRMTTVHSDKQAMIGYSKGASEILLDLCTDIQVDGMVRPLTPDDKKKILTNAEEMSKQALRVMGTAMKDLGAHGSKADLGEEVSERNLTWLGLVGMIDPPREEVKLAIETCKKANIRTVMITGDHALTAQAIAMELGIVNSMQDPIITGHEIEKASQKEIQQCNVFARVSPEHKLNIVDALQAEGDVIAMTGDGVNDAPALKKADVGVAMGITGTDVAKGAAAMVLADDNFASIVSAVEEGRGIYENTRKFVLFLISCNIAEVIIVFLGFLIGLPLPLVATQLLWINLATDGPPALALGLDPYDTDIMDRPPRDPHEPILNARAISSILVRGLIITGVTLLLFWWALEAGNVQWDDPTVTIDDGELAPARSVIFLYIIIAEMVVVFLCKSEKHTNFRKAIVNNKPLIYTVLISIAITLVIVYIPGAAAAFNLSKVDGFWWAMILVGLVPIIIGDEIDKWVWRKRFYDLPPLEQKRIVHEKAMKRLAKKRAKQAAKGEEKKE